MDHYGHGKMRGQVSLEFVGAFVVLLLLLILIARLFLWFVGTVVNRHKAFEASRDKPEVEQFYDRFNETNKLKVFP